MVEYTLRIASKAEKQLRKLPKQTVSDIVEALSAIEKNPTMGKALVGTFKGLYSYRVWPYRIVYEIIDHELVVLVVSIGHRKDVYRKL